MSRCLKAFAMCVLVASGGIVICAAALPVVRSLRVEGNSFCTVNEIRSWIATRPNLPYDSLRVESDLQAVVEAYRERGFLNASVKIHERTFSADSVYVDISLLMEEGRRTLVASFAVAGATVFTEREVFDFFETRPGDPLDGTLLERDVDDLLHRYEKAGYPFAQCSIVQLRVVAGPEVDSVAVTLQIDEGKDIRIESVRVEGNRETDPDVVIREARVRSGDVFDPEKMNTVRQRLQRMNIFSSVGDPELTIRQGKGELVLKVQEGDANTFDGVVGYVPPPAEGGDGYLMGLVSVSMRNLFGTGRKLRVRWEKEDRNTQDLTIGYSEPWLFGYPFNLSGEFAQRKQDTTYVRQGLRFRGDVLPSEVLSIGLIVTTESVIPSTDITALSVPRSSTVSVGGEILHDTQDDPYSPLSGARYRADYHYGRKNVTGSSLATDAPAQGYAVQRIGLDVDWSLQAFFRQVVAIGIHARQVESEGLDESELYRLGGANSLRGYRESQFIGSRIAWTNLEYRLILGRRSFFFGFIDTGYYFRPEDIDARVTETEGFKYGYGLGLRFDTALGNMGVSFALGKGDSFAQGKVHIGLVNEF